MDIILSEKSNLKKFTVCYYIYITFMKLKNCRYAEQLVVARGYEYRGQVGWLMQKICVGVKHSISFLLWL